VTDVSTMSESALREAICPADIEAVITEQGEPPRHRDAVGQAVEIAAERHVHGGAAALHGEPGDGGGSRLRTDRGSDRVTDVSTRPL
jgi:hypothetical protein